jgi:hypothetical protein
MAQAGAMRRGAKVRREIEYLHLEAEVARANADAANTKLNAAQHDAAAARAESDAASKRVAAAEKRRPDWVVALLAVVVALAGVLLGAWVNSNIAKSSAESAQRAIQFTTDEQHKEESRQKRAQVYADYLAAAREYSIALYLYIFDESAREPTAPRPRSRADFEKARTRVYAAEAAWLKQIDLVFVYGSQDAWKLSGEFQVALPGLGREHPAMPSTISADAPVPAPPDWQRYFRLEVAFRAMFCREVPAEPREGCR